ncbi:A/G-specific adenine glycosylase [Gammaproteobacteria bacterium]|nr:A/G-specific adenine glycosylase [Gammaproteobacteria bacterium]MDA8798277.1 A/G-specific adenine glycosylase [Gammaproteobacteria bacterium]MDC0513130.1 A/G-specific adenine glycosylase [Gammaproteobacteria bacterium]MDC0918415.1 A/G-specific adenine glycosylase [Gammaproteobacteria bacterium]
MNKRYQFFSQQVVQWYKNHGRHDLPWRKKVTPYRIWISEIMLQQTQVKTVIPYFKNFIQKYPSQKKLSEASEDQILAAWSGLGFYRRARNIFASKEIIKKNYGNRFPKEFQQIISLPGVGKSTAGAIMSLAYLEPHPILDGNVKRVISRFLKKELDLLKETELWNLSEEMVNRDDCFSYTQGIMDLGATICTPANPSCGICPVSSQCLSAFKVKSIKKNKAVSAKKVIVMNLSLVQTDQSFLLAKNEVDSIWKNLWLPFNSESLKNYAQNFKLISNQKIKHELTHRTLKINLKTYFSLKESEIETNQTYQWIKKDRIDEYGLPKPITKVIKEL